MCAWMETPDRSRFGLAAFAGLLLLLLPGCTSVDSGRLRALDSSLDVARQALEEGDLATAQVNLGALQSARPDDPDVLALAARLHQLTGNDRRQQETVAQLLAADPGNAFGLERLGLMRLQQGELAVATTYLTVAVTVDKDRWMAWNGLGIIADAQSRFAEAHSHFQRALELVPGHPKILANLGWSKLLDGDPVAGEALLRRALEIEPESVVTRSNLAFSVALQGRYEEAMVLYRELYEEPVAANNVGYAALVRQDREAARRYLGRAVATNPTYYRTAENNLATLE